MDIVGCVKGDGEVLTWVKNGLWSTDATNEGISRDYECGDQQDQEGRQGRVEGLHGVAIDERE